MAIKELKEIRKDGKIIDESMTAKDVFALGSPEKIIEIQWINDSQIVSLKSEFGVLAKVVNGREFVAINERGGSDQHHKLWVLNADGSRRLQVSDVQAVRGEAEHGEFRWFESPRISAPNVFGIIFECRSDHSTFQLDVDATNGAVLGVYATR